MLPSLAKPVSRLRGWRERPTHIILGSAMMSLPRLVSPRALWADIKAFASQRRPHQLIALAAAIAVPSVIILTFIADTKDAHNAPAQITYVNSWNADRSIEETRAAIREHEARRKAAEEERRRGFQKIQDFNNRLGI